MADSPVPPRPSRPRLQARRRMRPLTSLKASLKRCRHSLTVWPVASPTNRHQSSQTTEFKSGVASGDPAFFMPTINDRRDQQGAMKCRSARCGWHQGIGRRDAGSDVSGSRILFPGLADDHPSDPRRLPPSASQPISELVSQLIFQLISPRPFSPSGQPWASRGASGGIRQPTPSCLPPVRSRRMPSVTTDAGWPCAGAPVFRMSMPKTTTKDLARCLALDAWWLVPGGSCLLPRAALLRQWGTASVGRILA